MGRGEGRALKLAFVAGTAVVIIAIACAGMLAVKASARADIQNYLKGPNDFYPSGSGVNGSPVKLVIDTVGWNATRIKGNLGIGDGSVSVFDYASTRDVEYPDWGFMCGDVSTQPWVPGKEHKVAEPAIMAENNTTPKSENYNVDSSTGNRNLTPANASIGAIRSNDTGTFNRALDNSENNSGNATGGNTSRTVSAANNTTEETTGESEQNKSDLENVTYSLYHPISYLQPVKDVLSEYPLATPGTAYFELIGFQMPSGALINVGMKCTGYGY